MFWVFLFPFLFSLCFPASSPSSLPFFSFSPYPSLQPHHPPPPKKPMVTIAFVLCFNHSAHLLRFKLRVTKMGLQMSQHLNSGEWFDVLPWDASFGGHLICSRQQAWACAWSSALHPGSLPLLCPLPSYVREYTSILVLFIYLLKDNCFKEFCFLSNINKNQP